MKYNPDNLSTHKIYSDISTRAIIIGLFLMPIIVYLVALQEMIWHSLHWTSMSLPQLAVFLLALFVSVNLILKKIFPDKILSQSEMLIIYTMVAVTTSFTAHDNMVCLMGVLAHAFWFATPENDWANLFHKHLPEPLIISNPNAAMDFYKGESSFFKAEYIKSWLMPMITWTFLLCMLFFMLLCINVIIRKRWIEQEKLAYPIIQIPLQMTDPSLRFYKSRVMWIGFTVAGLISLINGLNYLYPNIPRIPIKEESYDLARYLTQPPWDAIGSLPIRFYPFLIGLSFLIPLDMTFSTWFFFLFRKWEQVFGRIMGWTNIPRFPFFEEQAIGSMLAIFIIAIWAGRLHFVDVFKKVIGLSKTDDSNEPLKYRTAVIGLILGLLSLIIFCRWLGMSVWLVPIFFGLYFAIAISVTRMRAEMGPPLHAIIFVNPQTIIVSAFGTRMLGHSNLAILALFYWFNRFNRSHPMPHQLEFFKIAERTGANTKKAVIAMLLAIFVGVSLTFWIYPYTLYKYGASLAGELLGAGWQAYDNLSAWYLHPRNTDFIGLSAIGASLVFSLLIWLARMKFFWFPFHPAGYALGISSGTIDVYWFALLVCSIIKWIVLKYGGIKTYNKVVPFFMGLVLGDFIVGCFWGILSLIVQRPLYTTWF